MSALLFSFVVCIAADDSGGSAKQRENNFPWLPYNTNKILNHEESTLANRIYARSLLHGNKKLFTPVLITLAVTSKQFDGITKILSSILDGTILPDQIYVMVSEEPYMLDNGISKEDLEGHTKLMRMINNTKLVSVVYTTSY